MRLKRAFPLLGRIRIALLHAAISIFGFVTGLLYPFVVFVAGILLLLMRKSAIYAFALYLVWGITKVFLEKGEFQAYSSLAIVFGILVYCLRLNRWVNSNNLALKNASSAVYAYAETRHFFYELEVNKPSIF